MISAMDDSEEERSLEKEAYKVTKSHQLHSTVTCLTRPSTGAMDAAINNKSLTPNYQTKKLRHGIRKEILRRCLWARKER